MPHLGRVASFSPSLGGGYLSIQSLAHSMCPVAPVQCTDVLFHGFPSLLQVKSVSEGTGVGIRRRRLGVQLHHLPAEQLGVSSMAPSHLCFLTYEMGMVRPPRAVRALDAGLHWF